MCAKQTSMQRHVDTDRFHLGFSDPYWYCVQVAISQLSADNFHSMISWQMLQDQGWAGAK